MKLKTPSVSYEGLSVKTGFSLTGLQASLICHIQ